MNRANQFSAFNNLYTIVASIKEAEKLMAKGFGPIGIGGKGEDELLGVLFEDKFILAWATGEIDIWGEPLGAKRNWVETYTVYREENEAWDRLEEIIGMYSEKGWQDLWFNNWRDLYKVIYEGTYCAEYNNRNPNYGIDTALIEEGIIKDLTPPWSKIREIAIKNFPEILDYEYPNSWAGYNTVTSDILEAYQGKCPERIFGTSYLVEKMPNWSNEDWCIHTYIGRLDGKGEKETVSLERAAQLIGRSIEDLQKCLKLDTCLWINKQGIRPNNRSEERY